PTPAYASCRRYERSVTPPSSDGSYAPMCSSSSPRRRTAYATPSLCRKCVSRASSSASSASGAFTAPTTTNPSPSVRFPSTSHTATGALRRSGRDAREDLADPCVVIPHRLAVREPDTGHRAIPADDAPELVPVHPLGRLAPDPLAAVLVPSQLRVGNGDPDVPPL